MTTSKGRERFLSRHGRRVDTEATKLADPASMPDPSDAANRGRLRARSKAGDISARRALRDYDVAQAKAAREAAEADSPNDDGAA